MTDESLPNAEERQASFADQAKESDPGLIREFGEFLRDNKKWWLIPIIVAIVILGLLVMAGDTVAPLIYPLF